MVYYVMLCYAMLYRFNTMSCLLCYNVLYRVNTNVILTMLYYVILLNIGDYHNALTPINQAVLHELTLGKLKELGSGINGSSPLATSKH